MKKSGCSFFKSENLYVKNHFEKKLLLSLYPGHGLCIAAEYLLDFK